MDNLKEEGRECSAAEGRMGVEASIEAFLVYIGTEKRLSKRTGEIYADVLGRFALWLKGQGIEEVGEVGSREVRQWQMELIEGGFAPATVKQALAAVGSWMRYLRREGIVRKDVMARVTAPKLPQRLPTFFRESEVAHIYEREHFPEGFPGERDQLLLRVLYETGMRRAELIGLRESSVDLEGMTIKVRGKRDKERIIPIEKELVRNIIDYLALKHQYAPGEEALFVGNKGLPITQAQVYDTVRRYMGQFSNAQKVSPHVFRHSFATHLLNEGAELQNIKELLGHANVGVTEIYTHVSREHLKEQYKHAHPRAKKQ